MVARLISACAPRMPRSRKRGCPNMRYFSEANGCSTVDRRSRIIGVNDSRFIALQLFACERLISWTAIAVGTFVVVELAAVKQRALALIVDGAARRHMEH